MTLQDAKRIARDLGFSLTRTEGEYRLAPLPSDRRSPAKREAEAYYTPDMDDALGTAWNMATSERSQIAISALGSV